MIFTKNNAVYCGQFHGPPDSYKGTYHFIGPTGPTGPTGYDGPIGYRGYQGITGPTGEQGLSGEIIMTGHTGSTGYVGSSNSQSFTGSTGANLNITEIYTLSSSITLNNSFTISVPSNYRFADIKVCSGGGNVTTGYSEYIGGGGSGNVFTIYNLYVSSSLSFIGNISSSTGYGNTVELSLYYNNDTIPICSITGGENMTGTLPSNGIISQTYYNLLYLNGNIVDADIIPFTSAYLVTLYGGYPLDISNVLTLSRGGSIKVDGDQNRFINYQGGYGGIIITFYN